MKVLVCLSESPECVRGVVGPQEAQESQAPGSLPPQGSEADCCREGEDRSKSELSLGSGPLGGVGGPLIQVFVRNHEVASSNRNSQYPRSEMGPLRPLSPCP